MSPPEQPSPSYQELAALVVDLTAQLERAHARIAELEARRGRDSTNSSTPPSADSIAAKAKRRADRSSRERSKDRKPGGQPGRTGSGLTPTTEPDRTETVAAPGEGAGCGGDLAEGTDAGMSWAQVWDTPADHAGEGVLPAAPAPLRLLRGDHHRDTAIRAGRHGGLRAQRQRRSDRAGRGGHCARRTDRDADGDGAVRAGARPGSSPAPRRGSPSAWPRRGSMRQ